METTISTVGGAVLAANIVGSVKSSVITIFVQVSNSITTDGSCASSTALGRIDSIDSVIAFLGGRISDIVTTPGETTI